MFNILLILVFVGGIVIAAIFAGVTFLQGVRNTQEIQITKQRLLETAVRVQNQARYVSGYIAIPRGSTGSSPYAYNQVPTWIDSKATNAAGVPFLYCPYRSTAGAGTAGTITMPSGSTYNINYTSNATTISQQYVTAGDAPPAAMPSGGIGLLIAATPQSNQPPNCSSITAASDGTPVVTGGIVVPIIPDNYRNKMQVATVPTELRFYMGTNNNGIGIPSGDGSGRDTSNRATVTTVMNLINYAKPAQATLVFPTGTYTFAHALSWGGRLQLIGAGTSSTTISTTSNTVDEFSKLSLQDIRVSDSGTFTINGTVEADEAALYATTLINIAGGTYKILDNAGYNTLFSGNMTIDGGGEIFSQATTDTAFNNLGNRGLSVISGKFWSSNGYMSLNPSTTNTVPVYIGAGGQILGRNIIINNTNSLTLKGGFVVAPGGELAGHNAKIHFNKVSDYAIYNHGTVSLTSYASIRINVLPGGGTTYGLILASGGSLYQQQTTSGYAGVEGASGVIRATTAIYDNGGSKIISANFGGLANVEAITNCWAGRSGTNLFTDSPSGATNGNNSYTNNSSGWNWLRLYNQSYYVCVK